MTTATAAKPPATPAVIFEGPVALDKIRIVSNVRKKFDKQAIKELAENIRSLGIISPVTLRTSSKDYELVAGERRVRAAKLAGLVAVPARVLALTDAQALEYQAAENIHRKDLTPIEEARAFKALLKANGDKTTGKYTVKDLAELVDKSERHVYRAVALLELPENIIDAIEDGRLTPAHGHQILRVPTDKRGEVCARALTKDYNEQLPTAKQLTEWVDRELGSSLDQAVFPINKPFADEIACTACPYNTGNQGKLFDGAEKGGCLNTPCFDKKTAAHWAGVQDQLEKQHGAKTILFQDYNVWEGQTFKGWVPKKKVPATLKLKDDQALIVSKSTGEVWLAEKPKPIKQPVSQPSSQPVSRPAYDAKAAFIGEAVQNAVQDAVIELAEKQPQKALAIVVDQLIPSWGVSEQGLMIVGAKNSTDLDKKLKKASTGQLASLALLIFLNEDPSYTDHFAEELGVSSKVAKGAKAEAEKEWAEQQKEAKAK